MVNFPGKWFEFTNKKEIKRLRADINDSFSLRIQIASSIIIAIIGYFVEDYIKCGKWWIQLIICLSMCVVVSIIFFLPAIQKYYKLRKRCNVLIKGKDAVNIFDDEIVYNVLVAYEYYFQQSNIDSNILKDDIKDFYNIEINYYVTSAINKLTSFTANLNAVIGEGKNRISKERAQNIVCIIDKLIVEAKIPVDTSEKSDYTIFKHLLGNI